jgi:4-hydroxy-3-methylbut-2-en-1-yl diphosphate reductase
MKINIDPQAGFCFGVTRVVSKAEEIIREQGKLYCLGEIVHNKQEIKRLEELGLITISQKEFLTLSDCRVLIRAHGEPPETYEHARKNNIELIDGTCPIVLKLQDRIKSDYSENHPKGIQIVIFGKKDHAEVRGLAGQTSYQTIIMESEDDFDKIDFSKPVHLYAQTTMGTDQYQHLQDLLVQRIKAAGAEPQTLKCTSSICRQVSGRIPGLRQFCTRHDVVLFVSYQQSSNGKLLYAQCKAINERTHFMTDSHDFRSEWFTNARSIGITGATSTPRWLLEEYAGKLENFLKAS